MQVAFVALPQGGGGGGKNPLNTVLALAVLVAAPYAGAALAGSLGVTSAIGTSLLTAGVALAGSALVNILVPPPSPTFAGVGGYGGGSAPSPTYSLQAQGNQARLGEPIPVVYGRHIVYPDFAATPYAEYVGNDQFLFQLH
ncbi:MAG: phage tail protein, partial [Proteobacteria bacterium]|nr:phage tail protein [Pseudomonadota bacterium]